MMKHRRKKDDIEDFFATPSLPTHIFRAGDVARILGIERWRLQKFLSGKHYRLSPSGHLGKGQGSWRLFNHQDLYRLAIANRMVEDGFGAKFVSMVLQEIEEHELLEANERGESTAPDIGLVRTEKRPRVVLAGPQLKQEPYYVLRLGDLIRSVDERILSDRSRLEKGK